MTRRFLTHFLNFKVHLISVAFYDWRFTASFWKCSKWWIIMYSVLSTNNGHADYAVSNIKRRNISPSASQSAVATWNRKGRGPCSLVPPNVTISPKHDPTEEIWLTICVIREIWSVLNWQEIWGWEWRRCVVCSHFLISRRGRIRCLGIVASKPKMHIRRSHAIFEWN